MIPARQYVHPSPLYLLFLLFGIALVVPQLGLATDLPYTGGRGGTYFSRPCPSGSYLVGLAGRTGQWVDQIAPVCAPWLRGSQTFGAQSVGPTAGTSGGGKVVNVGDATCRRESANRFAVSSLVIQLLRSSNRLVQYVGALCTSLTPSASLESPPFFEFGLRPAVEPRDEPLHGPIDTGDLETSRRQSCPAGEVAVGIHGRAGQFVDAIGLLCGPIPPRAGAPATKVDPRIMMPRTDLFEIIKPSTGDTIPHGKLVILATPPQVGSTDVAEIELRYLDAPANLRHSYPYTTVFSATKAQLLDGYPVSDRVTGGYVGRWQIRVRSGMKTPPGPWGFPKQFIMVKAQAPPPMAQTPRLNAPITQTPAPSSATTQMRRSSSMIVPRGVEEEDAPKANQPVATTSESEKKP